MLHNSEYHALSQMCKEFKEAMNAFLNNNETYNRVQNYIKLANDNLDVFYKAVCEQNNYYLRYKLRSVEFNKESLINRNLYEIRLCFINDKGNYDSTCFGVDTLIIFLADAGLVKDELYYVRGKGFHSGYLSIEENGTRLWSNYKQLFRKDEIDSLIKSIPNYIIYDVRDSHHNTIYANE